MTIICGRSNTGSSHGILPTSHVLETVAAEVDLMLQIATGLDHCLGTALEGLPELATQEVNTVQDLDLLVQSLGDLKRVMRLLAKNEASGQKSLASADVIRAVKLEAIRERLIGNPTAEDKRSNSPGNVELL